MIRVVSVYLREAGRAAAVRAAPLYFGVFIVSMQLFAGANAMRASDAVGSLAESRPLRALLWLAWVAAAAPAAKILFEKPSVFYLRTLPRTGVAIAVALGFGLLVLEAPWIALFARGAGPIAGAAAALVAAGLHATVIAPAPIAAGVLVAAVLWPAPDLGLLGLGLVAGSLALRQAYRRAPERAAVSRSLVGGPAPVALARALLAASVRGTPSSVWRGLVVALAGGALTALVAQNNDAQGSLRLTLGMTGPLLLVACGGVVEAMAGVLREMDWLLVTARAGWLPRRLGRALACATVGLVFGLLMGGFAGGGVPVIAAVGLWGATLAVVVGAIERVAGRQGEREGGVAVSLVIGLAIASATAAGFLGALVLPFAVVLGALLA